MLFAFLGTILLLTSILLRKIYYKKKDSDDWRKSESYSTHSEVVFGFSCVSFFLLVLCQIGNYYFQVNDIEKLNIIEREIEVHKERATDITSQLESILVDKYSEHEKDVFESLSGEGISIYLAKYPELNAHKTFTHLSETLVELSDKQYESKLKALELEKSIKSRKRYIHIIPYFLPSN